MFFFSFSGPLSNRSTLFSAGRSFRSLRCLDGFRNMLVWPWRIKTVYKPQTTEAQWYKMSGWNYCRVHQTSRASGSGTRVHGGGWTHGLVKSNHLFLLRIESWIQTKTSFGTTAVRWLPSIQNDLILYLHLWTQEAWFMPTACNPNAHTHTRGVSPLIKANANYWGHFSCIFCFTI